METASEIKAFNKLFAEYHGLFGAFRQYVPAR